ncbi:MAG: hypothetical protein WC371_01960 [Parachlamydiales bacterium]
MSLAFEERSVLPLSRIAFSEAVGERSVLPRQSSGFPEVVFCSDREQKFFLVVDGKAVVARSNLVRDELFQIFEAAVNGNRYFFTSLQAVEDYYVVTNHGTAVGKERDIFYFADYNRFIFRIIKRLEEEEKIAKGFFGVPEAVCLKRSNGWPVYLLEKKIDLLTPDEMVQKLRSFSREKRCSLAKEAATIIFESGFADVYLGSFCLGKDGIFYFVESKPFGLYLGKNVINFHRLRHNGRIGVEKFRLILDFFEGFEEMKEEIERFLAEHPLHWCAICREC